MTLPTVQNPAQVSAPRLPAWLERIVDVPAHPDIGWQLPGRLPTPGDLRNGVAVCERLLNGGQVTPAFAKQCIAKLLVAFEPNTKLSADDMRLRAMVWIEANGDLCDGLWAEATAEAIRNLKWMPKPAEFRALVDPRIEVAKKHLSRLNGMLDAHQHPKEKAYEREPHDVRLKTLRDSLKAIGKTNRAAGYERQLAEREGRQPEAWPLEVSTAIETKPERPPFKPGSSPSDIRCAELAKEFHTRRTAA